MIHTAYDVMKEYLITGAELDGPYQIPVIPPIQLVPKKSIDFVSSKSRSLKGHKDLTVNFYIDDKSFLQIWNQPDQYVEHLKCFHSVCSPDFTIASGMPTALNIYNLYRNHALGFYFAILGVNIIPSVNVISPKEMPWIFDGTPHRSTVSCCTNGRVRSKSARLEFCENFKEMLEVIEPTKVVIVGIVPDELNVDVPIINLNSRSQNMKEMFRKEEPWEQLVADQQNEGTKKPVGRRSAEADFSVLWGEET